MNKKAFEIQFNWIFILVAGAAILLFFTAVVMKQKSASEISTKTTVLKSIDAIITGASISTDTTNIIDVPNSDIEINCNRVSIGGVSKQYQNLILFAPSLVKGSKLITQTLDFSVPYKATNLLYLTSLQMRYIIIGNNVLANEIDKSMPSVLKKEFYKSVPSTIKDENNYKVRFIIFGDNLKAVYLTNLQGMQDSDVTAIKIINGGLNEGEIKFYQKDGLNWKLVGKSYYTTKAALLGAIYSDTLEAYECNMRNSFSRLKLVSEVYMGRTEKLALKSREFGRLICSNIYVIALTHLKAINTTSDSISKSPLNFAKDDVDKIVGAAESLAEQNKEAQKKSCVWIY